MPEASIRPFASRGNPRSSRDGRRRGAFAVAAVHLAVLWSLAVAQPLFDLLGDAPEFFVARENTRGDILLLALGLTLVGPLVLTAVEALAAAASPAAGRFVHLGLVFVLAAAFALQVAKELIGDTAAVLIPLAVLLGLAAAAAYARARVVRTLLTALAPAPLVFAFVFLVLSPVSKLVFPRDAAATGVAVRGETPVVMIVFDELSGLSLMGADRRIDAGRLPAFARLSRDATWYRNATTVADFTERAVPALLTGDVPARGSLPIASDHPRSLFTLLGRDYSLDVTEPITDVCPARLCPETGRPATHRRLRSLVSDLSVVSLHLLAPEDLRRRLPAVDRSFGDFRRRGAAGGGQGAWSAPPAAIEERVRQFDAFVGRLRLPQAAGAHLSFVHVELPHTPLEFLPSGQRYLARGDPAGLESAGVWTKNRALVREAQRRHLLQLGYADRLLGQALAQLRRAGLYDDALIVVAADHGIGFRPGAPYRAAVAENLAEIASIPLLIKAPAQREGRIDDANVRSIDVLPTIAARLGVRPPWTTDGRPAGTGRSPASITLQPFYGKAVLSLPFAEFVRRRDVLAARLAADFGGGGAERVFRAGPHADLVGERVAALRAAQVGRARLELADGGLLTSTSPTAPVVPALLSGRVVGVPRADHVAVVLNGTVATVTPLAQPGDTSTFHALVPPTALASGSNRVAGLAISGAGARRRLVRLQETALDGFRLVERDGRRLIVGGPDGDIRVAAGIDGFVEEVTVEDGVTSVRGWAGDTDRLRPATLVIAFAGGRLLAAGRPSQPRADLARKFGFALAAAGFELGGRATGRQEGRESLEVFAVVGRRASLLRLTDG